MKTINCDSYNKEKGITKEERKGCFLFTGILISIGLWILICFVTWLVTLVGK